MSSDDIQPTDSLVCGPDWPLSCGVSLYVRLLTPAQAEGGLWKLSDKEWLIGVVDEVSVVRTIELVTHEVSHAVDAYFEMTKVVPCTVLRAYTLDWLVGKTLYAMLPVAARSRVPKDVDLKTFWMGTRLRQSFRCLW